MVLRNHPQGSESLLQDLWRSKAWRLFPMLLAYITGITLLIPFVPTLMTDYFASNRAGRQLHCDQFPRGEAPVQCHDAHADVVLWSSWSSFASNTVVSVLLMPILGHWSDLHGRRPFFLLAMSCACIPVAIVLLHITTGFPLEWYYLVQVLTSSVSSVSTSLAYLADSLSPHHRAAAFGLIMAAFSMGFFIGPAVGSQMASENAALASLGTILACLVYVALVLPESLTPEAIEEAKQKLAESRAARAASGEAEGFLSSTSRAFNILLRSSLFKKLTVCIMVTGMVSEGIQDLLIQYLQLKMNFRVKDQAKIFMMFGGCGLLVQTFVLRALLGLLGEQRVLCLGIAANLMYMVVMGMATAKWQAFAAIALGSLGAISVPTISSIKANNAQEHEQGSVQGALFGARSLASGVGPLLFAWMFKEFTNSESSMPYFPGAPLLLAAVLLLVALAVAASIPANAGGNAGAVRQLSWRRLSTFKTLPTDEAGAGQAGEAGQGDLQRGLLQTGSGSLASIDGIDGKEGAGQVLGGDAALDKSGHLDSDHIQRRHSERGEEKALLDSGGRGG